MVSENKSERRDRRSEAYEVIFQHQKHEIVASLNFINSYSSRSHQFEPEVIYQCIRMWVDGKEAKDIRDFYKFESFTVHNLYNMLSTVERATNIIHFARGKDVEISGKDKTISERYFAYQKLPSYLRQIHEIRVLAEMVPHYAELFNYLGRGNSLYDYIREVSLESLTEQELLKELKMGVMAYNRRLLNKFARGKTEKSFTGHVIARNVLFRKFRNAGLNWYGKEATHNILQGFESLVAQVKDGSIIVEDLDGGRYLEYLTMLSDYIPLIEAQLNENPAQLEISTNQIFRTSRQRGELPTFFTQAIEIGASFGNHNELIKPFLEVIPERNYDIEHMIYALVRYLENILLYDEEMDHSKQFVISKKMVCSRITQLITDEINGIETSGRKGAPKWQKYI